MEEQPLDTTLHHVLVLQTPEPEHQPPTPEATSRRQAKRQRKAAPIDHRRREANRLAAERSRGRQHEKVVALEVAIQALGDENLRLREEIARLETGNAEAPMSLDLIDAPAEDDNSRTLLNALLSAPPAPPAEEMWLDSPAELNENWMMGMDDLFPGVESGRLGELANVAAGQDSSSFAEVMEEHVEHPLPTETPRRPIPAPPMRPTNTAALNTEMEKVIRDDLRETKEAIARIQKEIAFYRGQGDAVPEPVALSSALDILSRDDDEVMEKTKKIDEEISELEQEADVLRVVITRTRDARYEEGNKLSAVVNELRALEMDGGERERDRITGVLRALRGHISAVIANPGISDGNGFTPFSSATARRKRGRPPKNPAMAKYGLSLLSPGRDGDSSDLPDTPIRPTRSLAHRKSRLAQELRISPGPSQQVGPSQVEEGETSQAAHAHAHDDYLLSHLTDAVQARDGQMALDSTSFAAFLSPPTEAIQRPEDHPIAEAGGTETPTVLSRFKRGPPGSCDICSRTQTSVWRKLTFEGEELRVCNACGLYYTKFGVPRPAELWGDGRTVKKRKASEGRGRRKRKNDKMDDFEVNGGGEDVAHSLNDVGRAVQKMFAAEAIMQE